MSAPFDRPADHRAITQLNDDFGHELDRGDVGGFVALFTPDALYTNGPRVLQGSEEIRQFYLDRTRDGPRTSRHVLSGLRIRFTGSSSATGISTCITFAAAGLPPVASTLPAIVADFDDVYAFDGCIWRFAERHIRTLFKAASP